MIWVTGDTHRKIDSDKVFNTTKVKNNDYLIIAGDFGFVWYNEEDRKGFYEDIRLLDNLNKLGFTILFIDGNHENFDMLSNFPYKNHFGGKVQVLRPNVFHLCRGELYKIEGKRIFTFGGAVSIDKNLRVEGHSWWSQEVPKYSEFLHGHDTLDKCGNKVDYVITHCAPTRVLYYLDATYREDSVTQGLDTFVDRVEFRKWIFGHYHKDIDFNAFAFENEKIKHYRCVYNDFIKLE